MFALLMLAVAVAGAQCPDRLPAEYADDPRSSGRMFLIVKDERSLGVYEGDVLVPGRCFSVQLGPEADSGPKVRRGDMRTPEGWYAVSHRNPRSRFGVSLGIDYPNFDDVMRGIEEGVITYAEGNALTRAINAGRLPSQSSALGGDIFIHGNPGRWVNDWTWGCMGLFDENMAVVYELGVPGTPVLIVPTLGESKSARP